MAKLRNLIPPKLSDADLTAAAKAYFAPDVQAFAAAANEAYWAWEKIKHHRPLPRSLDQKTAWAAIKLSRSGHRRELSLVDASGESFSFWLPQSTFATLHEVDRWSGNTLAIAEGTQATLTGMRERVIVSSLMEEAIATAQIEGAVTTRKVAKQMLVTGRAPRDRSEIMIRNSYQTIQLIRKRCDRKLDMDLLFEIQESITRGTLDDDEAAGRLRREDEDINVIDTSSNEVVFSPPNADDLPKRLRKLFAFANDDEGPFIHPVVKGAILHFWLAYEHPFVDGNGRTARALFYWFMLKRGYWLFEFLTISRVIVEAPAQYYRAFLHTESDQNDLTYSIMHMLRVTHQAILSLREWLARKQVEQKAFETALRKLIEYNHRQRELLQHALRHPDYVYTFQEHQTHHNITLVTARRDLLGLASAGLLQEIKHGRQRGFRPVSHLQRRLAKRQTK